MEGYFITMGISIILKMLKNDKSRRQYKNAMIKLRDGINAAFPELEEKTARQKADEVF